LGYPIEEIEEVTKGSKPRAPAQAVISRLFLEAGTSELFAINAKQKIMEKIADRERNWCA
jgi:hypothetical protein